MSNLPIYLVDYSCFSCPDERMFCDYQKSQASKPSTAAALRYIVVYHDNQTPFTLLLQEEAWKWKVCRTKAAIRAGIGAQMQQR